MRSVDYQENTLKCCHHHILRLKWTKFDFGCGSAPDPVGGAPALPRPPSWIKGVLLLKGWEGKGGGRGKGRGGKERGKEGGGGDGTSPAWSSPNLGSTVAMIVEVDCSH